MGTTRNSRLKEVYDWCFCKSINAFAKEVGVPQRTMSDYINNVSTPKTENLKKVIARFPEFNEEWLLEGRGSMFNPAYVTTEPQTSNIANGDNNNQTIHAGADNKLVEELAKSRSSIVKQVLRKIAKALECPTKEEADEHLKELEETLNDMNL